MRAGRVGATAALASLALAAPHARGAELLDPTPRQMWGGADPDHALGQGAASCDLDGDGLADLALPAPWAVESAGEVMVHVGWGGGFASEATVLTSAAEPTGSSDSISVQAADFNGDGHCDLAAGGPGGVSDGITVFSGRAGGLPVAAKLLSSSALVGGDPIVADLNGDGFDDLVAEGSLDTPELFAFAGSAAGLAAEPTWLLPWCSGPVRCEAAAAGDVNGDGFGDLVGTAVGNNDPEATYACSTCVYLGNEGGADVVHFNNPGPERLTAAGVGDVNGDGYDDVAFGGDWEDVNVFQGGVGTPELVAVLQPEPDVSSLGFRMLGANVDGDSYSDMLVFGSAGEEADQSTVMVFPGGAAGPSVVAEQVLLAPADSGDGFGLGLLNVGDLAGDAAAEVVVIAPSDDQDFYGRAYLFGGLPGGGEDRDGDGVVGASDCDDRASQTHPGAAESCDGLDNDCDGVVDEDAIDPTAWAMDADADGYTVGESVLACEAPAGHAPPSTLDDCDDDAPAVHPGATDTPADGVDQDCDGGDAAVDSGRPTDDGKLPPCGCTTGAGPEAPLGLLAALAGACRGRTWPSWPRPRPPHLSAPPRPSAADR